MAYDSHSHVLGGLFHGFEGQRVATDEELTQGLAASLISLDANVLLGLYRYPDEVSSALLEALDAFAERVFVSHQAMREFWRNRTSVLADRSKARDEVEKQLSARESAVLDALHTWAKKIAIDEDDLEQARLLVARQFDVLRKLVSDNHRDDVENYPSPSEDPIVQQLETLLEGKVGRPMPKPDFDAAVVEGQRRHAAEEPPGYKEKAAAKAHLPEGVAGDYLVWLQSIAEAKQRSLDLLLVTADEKEDWYWRSWDTVIGPRTELTKEFFDATGKRLMLMTPLEFIRRYSALGGDVSDQALAELERHEASDDGDEELPAENSGSWTEAAVHQLLEQLAVQAPVQAAVIRAAAANGGSVDRREVYRLGGYSPKRMLRGFTRPVRRMSRLLQEKGALELNAPEMLSPRYDHGVQANAFEIPQQVVEILTRT
ncbi:PIN-like domain-containing protein [Blastococcus litoris]|uniref:PIN-like domain-containing protein n=1 Tax=Blastococcus litoris TaxID=2171622 RepID=UPI0013DEF28A|nr:PIN-like domain-containing protein [Blastococcus litoris]